MSYERFFIKARKEDQKKTKKALSRGEKSRIICSANGLSSIPTFTDVPVSTMTIIAHTNLIINTDKFYKYVPVIDYITFKKKRGRKKHPKTPTFLYEDVMLGLQSLVQTSPLFTNTNVIGYFKIHT